MAQISKISYSLATFKAIANYNVGEEQLSGLMVCIRTLLSFYATKDVFHVHLLELLSPGKRR